MTSAALAVEAVPAVPPPPPAPAPSPPPPAQSGRKPRRSEAPPPLPDDGPAGPPPEEGAPAWVMTFGDLMSLLLTFFILLFSMSSIQVEKFKAAAASLQESFGEEGAGLITEEAPTSLNPDSTPVLVDAEAGKVSAAIADIATVLEQFVLDNDLGDQIDVSQNENGVYLRIQDMALFRPGSSGIEDASVGIVERLGLILRAIEVPLVVSGHTDDIPIRSQVFHSNWELSAARAAGVARLLVGTGHAPAAVTVEAYGEFRPVADNATAEGRSHNRRVELYYARQSIEDAMRARGLLAPPPGLGKSGEQAKPEAAGPASPGT